MATGVVLQQRASAPGKLLLLGEYAVTAGGRALVAAVNRRAVGRICDNPPPPSPVLRAVFERSKSVPIEIDTSGFSEHDKKLGIGSSAAVAVVAAALADAEDVLRTAIEGHRASAGGVGSGVDVAASFCGGIIAAGRQPGPIEQLGSGPGLHLAVLFTGSSASTAEFVRAARNTATWVARCDAMAEVAESGIQAWRHKDGNVFMSAIREYGGLMAALGEEACVPIVTDQIAAIMADAQSAGAAAKPSGAGGGDIAIVFSEDAHLGQRIAASNSATCIDMKIDPVGLIIAC